MTIEEKLKQLAALAESLDEAKKDESADDSDDKQDDKDSDIEQDEDGGEGTAQDASDDEQEVKESEQVEEQVTEKVEVAPIDLGPLFEGQEFSEEFKSKATAIFEAAVDARVKQKEVELKESMEVQLDESAESIVESLESKVDGYLDYMVEQWMKNNTLAIDRGIKVEIMESFMAGMKQVFESHYIDVPDEKYDLVEEAQSQAAELSEKLDSVLEENVELRSVLKDTVRVMQIEEATKGLAATDAEKFRELAESLTYTDSEEFATKLEGLRENYFAKKPAAKTELKEEFMSDTVPVNTPKEELSESIDPSVAGYLKAIRK